MKRIKLNERMMDRIFIHGKDYCKHTRNGIAVYEIACDEQNLSVYHYSTCILWYDLKEQKVVSYDGWSNSDRDFLNATLEYLMHPDRGDYFNCQGGFLHQNKETIEELQFK